MKKISLLLFLLLLGEIEAYGQTVKTISVEFIKTVREGNSKEVVKGSIYYQAPDKIILLIREPIKQWMLLEGKLTTLYYPDERRAIQITGWSSTSLPFFQAFLGGMKEDYGLSELGYKLEGNEIKGDTLVTHWNPPEKLKGRLGEITLAVAANEIIYVESRDPGGQITAKVQYSNHIQYGAVYFPLQIVTTRYSRGDTTSERVVYGEPLFDKPLPPEIRNFKIPSGVKIEGTKW